MKNKLVPKKLTLKLVALAASGLLLFGCAPKDTIHTPGERLETQIEDVLQEPKEFFAEIKPKDKKENSKTEVGSTASQGGGSAGQNPGSSSQQGNGTSKPSQSQTQPQPQQPVQPEQKPAVPQQPPQGTGASKGNYVVGYYASWGLGAGVPATSLDGDKLTHINYAFATIDKNLKVAMAAPGVDKQNFAHLRQLKQEYPHLRTLISIGGWDYSGLFSDAALNAKNREIFAQSCLDFILEHGFDGVDLDWEFPVSGGMAGNINRPADKQNFTLLLKAIREKLDAQSAKDGREYLLTIAGGVGQSYLNKIEPAKVAGLVDYIFVMGYDMHGTWDSYADLNAPLYTPTEDSPQYKVSVHDGIKAYKNAGVPASKLVLGMPFYGYRYTTSEGLYGKFSSAKSVSYNILRSSFLGDDSFTEYWHEDAMVPYLVSDDTFVSFENEKSIMLKADYARQSGLAGVGAWELSQDKQGILLDAAYEGLHS